MQRVCDAVFCYSDVMCLKVLQLYVFDDTDPDETTYLGVASIPLITLAHDKPIQGTFELIKVFNTDILLSFASPVY